MRAFLDRLGIDVELRLDVDAVGVGTDVSADLGVDVGLESRALPGCGDLDVLAAWTAVIDDAAAQRIVLGEITSLASQVESAGV